MNANIILWSKRNIPFWLLDLWANRLGFIWFKRVLKRNRMIGPANHVILYFFCVCYWNCALLAAIGPMRLEFILFILKFGKYLDFLFIISIANIKTATWHFRVSWIWNITTVILSLCIHNKNALPELEIIDHEP